MTSISKLTHESVYEQLLVGVVKIIAIDSKSNESSGTGFFYQMQAPDNKNISLIITNKHVLDGCKKLKIIFHQADDSGQKPNGLCEEVSIETPWDLIVYHPDEKVDLASIFLLPIGDVFYKGTGKKLHNVNFNSTFLPNEELLLSLDVVEDVYMIGFPLGLSDDVNNLPLVRKGITSSHPGIDYKGKPEFVIDMACFPGSSGSPVVLVPKAGKSQILLLGILYGGPYMNAQGKIEVRDIPMNLQPYSVTQIMIHLGYVLKANLILGLEKEILKKHKHLI